MTLYKQNYILKSSFFDFQLFLSESDEIQSSGQHHKQLVILSDCLDEMPGHLDFLRKIMSAVKFNLDKDVLWVQLQPRQSWSFLRHQQQNPSHCCISFGISPSRMGLQFESLYYQPFRHADCTFLLAHSLAVLQQEVRYKGALWKCLQHLFLTS